MIKVVAKFTLKPDMKEKSIPLFRELVRLTRQEEGCVNYELAQSSDDNNVLVILESWKEQTDLNRHSQSEHFTRIIPELTALCSRNPAVDSYIQII